MNHGDETVQTTHRDWLSVALVPLGLFAGLAWALSTFALPWQLQLEWVPSLGVGLDWHVDALSAQFLVLITGIGAMVFIYASGYMAHDAYAGRFHLLLLLFMAAMIGAVIVISVVIAAIIVGRNLDELGF